MGVNGAEVRAPTPVKVVSSRPLVAGACGTAGARCRTRLGTSRFGTAVYEVEYNPTGSYTPSQAKINIHVSK